ncbi:hypothetical protein BWI93_27315 [Siphonobacter sp. BAB-5385]|uniref:hypothetical protein n=1 Tax=Siphonobacter sp. BAB-5385 TaxID=1864822 RepID=UPI000B9E563B|nr:hypothetical protein [Siphonobacter sp. BAB-5385]OZI05099.1 hypothetical protein BWI93_27315 [Siphonobacter sp. BAB-5385]
MKKKLLHVAIIVLSVYVLYKTLLPFFMKQALILITGVLLTSCGCDSYEQEIKDLRWQNHNLQAQNKVLSDSLNSTLLLLQQPNGPGMILEE